MELPQYSKCFSNFDWPWYMPEVTEYKGFLEQFPFRDIKVWGEVADRYFPNSEVMIKWIDQPAIVPFIKSVSQADKPHFRDFVIEKMIEETIQEDGTCFETFRRVNVFARK